MIGISKLYCDNIESFDVLRYGREAKKLKTPLNTLFAAVRTEAEKLGESVERAELIGCLPAAVLEGVTPEEIGLFDWDESRLLDRSVG